MTCTSDQEPRHPVRPPRLDRGLGGPGALAWQLEQALAELYSLHELAKMLASSIELERVVAYILDGMCGLMGTESSFLYSHEPELGIFKLLGTQGPALDLPDVIVSTAAHWIAQATTTEAPIVLTVDELSLAVTTLRSHDTIQGLLGIGTRVPRQFTPADLNRLTASSHLAAMALESARLHARIQTLAITDGLTGLCNHRHFYDELHREMFRARRQKVPVSLLLLDIDHFKEFNDAFGHIQGDEVLRSVARILQETTRDMDMVARYGGEEFAVILPGVGPAQARRVAERIRHQVVHTRFHDQAPITVSIGIASLDVDQDAQESPQDFVHRADQALYRAKQTGRNRVRVYEQHISENDEGSVHEQTH